MSLATRVEPEIWALRNEVQAWLDAQTTTTATYDEFFEKRVILYHCSVALGIRRARRGGSKERSRTRCIEIINAQRLAAASTFGTREAAAPRATSTPPPFSTIRRRPPRRAR